jgi:hypothetical protein
VTRRRWVRSSKSTRLVSSRAGRPFYGLVDRGLKGVELIISDACRGLVESAAEFYRRRAGSGVWCIFTGTSSARSTIRANGSNRRI